MTHAFSDGAGRPAIPPAGTPPLLLVVVDTEEEFDWDRPLARAHTAVSSIAAQYRAQEIFARYDVVPTYVIDYPIATDVEALRVLGDLLADGRCEIGAHLHPWVNPPHEEAVTAHNSYAGNLPARLEREKLRRLTQAIADNLGRRPTIYKAGRYGIGPNTAEILAELGYVIDLSMVPYTDFAADGGPDFRRVGFNPFWIGGPGKLLEIPTTAGFAGAAADWSRWLYPALHSRVGRTVRAPGIAARARLLERIRLTSEGVDRAALHRLTASLLRRGCRVFSFSYHSPSLAPGNTPYVRNDGDLAVFLGRIDRYLDHFINELGGRPTTPHALYDMLG